MSPNALEACPLRRIRHGKKAIVAPDLRPAGGGRFYFYTKTASNTQCSNSGMCIKGKTTPRSFTFAEKAPRLSSHGPDGHAGSTYQCWIPGSWRASSVLGGNTGSRAASRSGMMALGTTYFFEISWISTTGGGLSELREIESDHSRHRREIRRLLDPLQDTQRFALRPLAY